MEIISPLFSIKRYGTKSVTGISEIKAWDSFKQQSIEREKTIYNVP